MLDSEPSVPTTKVNKDTVFEATNSLLLKRAPNNSAPEKLTLIHGIKTETKRTMEAISSRIAPPANL
ncbi:MAG: hypothetical protein IJ421_03885 [Prevotella sp.]|nr:hypothetical protein [Prevotella sp.]